MALFLKAVALCALVSSHVSLVASNPVPSSETTNPTPTDDITPAAAATTHTDVKPENGPVKYNEPCLDLKRFIFRMGSAAQGTLNFVFLSRLNDTIPCIQAIPAPPKENRTYNLNQLYRFLDSFYGWASIIQNSTDTPGFLSKVDVRNSTWTVHNSTVNWKEGLRKINETEWDSGFEYHHAITKLFASFNDAHTVYAMLALAFPITLPFRIDSKVVDGEQVLVLNSNVLTQAYNDVSSLGFQRIVPEEHFGKPIESVNGQDPIEFFQTYFADPWGSYRSAGARLNKFLTTSNSGGPPLMWTGIFNFTDLTFNFGNGSTLTTDIFVAPPLNKSVDGYYNDMNDPTEDAASFYQFVFGWDNVTSTIPDNITGTTINKGSGNTSPDENTPQSVKPQGRSFSDNIIGFDTSSSTVPFFKHLKKNTKTFLKPFPNGTAGPFEHATAIIYPREEDASEPDSKPIGAVFNYSGVPVWKYPSFELDSDEMQIATMETLYAIGESFKNSDRIVIDVTGNGGGVILLMYTMLAALVPGFKNYTDMCQPFQLPMSEFGREWINSFDKFNVTANYKNESEVQEYLSDLDTAIAYYTTTDPDNGAELSRRQKKAFGNSKFAKLSLEEQNKKITEFRKNLQAKYNKLSNDGISKIGFTPYDADGGMDPLTLKPLKPDFLGTTVEYEWGGTKANFSRRFLALDCTQTDMPAIRKKFTKRFKELVVLTDGTCGSACSAFTSQILASGHATVVSVGGRVGEPLDTGSFNGGNVDLWNLIFGQYMNNLALASMVQDESRISLQESNVPLPLTDSAIFGLNFAIGSSNLLPANALPVEWYTKPANVHLDVWPSYMALDYSMWSKLAPEQYKEWDKIYEHLAASSMKDLDMFP